MTIPPSREVRLTEGRPVGELEAIAFELSRGKTSTADLARAIVAMELIVEGREAKAINGLRHILRTEFVREGVIQLDDLDHAINAYHERTMLDGEIEIEHGTTASVA